MVIKLPWKPARRRSADRNVGTRALLLLIGAMIAASGAGCGPDARRTNRVTALADPVLPSEPVQRADAQPIVSDWLTCTSPGTDTASKSKLADVVLTYHNTGRDFKEPAGPDGYLIRMIPLNSKFQAIRIQADVVIGLFENPPPTDPAGHVHPLKTWSIPRQELEQFWTPNILIDGYLFRLDWNKPVPEPGNYMLIVKLILSNEKKQQVFCRRIPFQDMQARTPDTETPKESPSSSTD